MPGSGRFVREPGPDRETVAMTAESQSGIDHLYHIDTFMASMIDLDELLAVIIREATLAVDSESCSLALYEEDLDELSFCVALGADEERAFERALTRIHLPLGKGIIGYCAKHRQAVNIPDAYDDPRFDREADRKTGFHTRSVLAVPMVRGGKLIGAVEAVNKKNQAGFSERDLHILTVLAAQAALVIENARLIEENLQQEKLAALGQGIAGAAHCIKNILNGVSGGEYILGVGIKRDNMRKVEQGWDILTRNTGMMRDLVLDMLSYSRSREPEYGDTDVNEICHGIARLMSERARGNDVEIVLDLERGIGRVILDPKGIYRCILNLVVNAIDAADKEDAVVRIATRAHVQDRRIEIAVSDNGRGIDEEDRNQLFKAFFSTKGSKGTGLGLAVTRKIIHEHGGDIRVESEPGAGASFKMTLPLKRAAGEFSATA